MRRAPVLLVIALALVAGAAGWLVAAQLSGRREPWDSAAYWALAYPASIAVCALFAVWQPERPWRWAFAVFAGQFVGMVLHNGELGGLWPLGLVLFAILALPGVVAAWFIARLRVPPRDG